MTPERWQAIEDAMDAVFLVHDPDDYRDHVPDIIWIGAVSIGVEMVSELTAATWSDRAALALLGHFEHAGQRIELSPLQGAARLKETLLHEVLHGVFDHAGITDEALAKSDQEDLVNRLAPVLMDVLRSNPRLVWLLMSHTG